jgi:hypothetical protein
MLQGNSRDFNFYSGNKFRIVGNLKNEFFESGTSSKALDDFFSI